MRSMLIVFTGNFLKGAGSYCTYHCQRRSDGVDANPNIALSSCNGSYSILDVECQVMEYKEDILSTQNMCADSNICLKDTCFNGGSCRMEQSTLQCICPCGFGGNFCEGKCDKLSNWYCIGYYDLQVRKIKSLPVILSMNLPL